MESHFPTINSNIFPILSQTFQVFISVYLFLDISSAAQARFPRYQQFPGIPGGFPNSFGQNPFQNSFFGNNQNPLFQNSLFGKNGQNDGTGGNNWYQRPQGQPSFPSNSNPLHNFGLGQQYPMNPLFNNYFPQKQPTQGHLNNNAFGQGGAPLPQPTQQTGGNDGNQQQHNNPVFPGHEEGVIGSELRPPHTDSITPPKQTPNHYQYPYWQNPTFNNENTQHPSFQGQGGLNQGQQPQIGNQFPTPNQMQPQIGNQFPTPNQNQPQIGNQFPTPNQHQPQIGNQFPTPNQMQPQIGNHFPGANQIQPQIGNHFPGANQVQPQMGKHYPEANQMQPQMGNHYPGANQMQPQMGNQFPSANQMQPQIGNQMQPQTGNQFPQQPSNQFQNPTTNQISPAPTNQISPAPTNQISPAPTNQISPVPTNQILTPENTPRPNDNNPSPLDFPQPPQEHISGNVNDNANSMPQGQSASESMGIEDPPQLVPSTPSAFPPSSNEKAPPETSLSNASLPPSGKAPTTWSDSDEDLINDLLASLSDDAPPPPSADSQHAQRNPPQKRPFPNVPLEIDARDNLSQRLSFL